MRNIKKVLFSVLMIWMSSISSFAQMYSIKSFQQLFQEIEFGMLHVYTFAREPSTFPSTSIYPYKGQKLSELPLKFLSTALKKEDFEYYDEFFATHRYYVGQNLEAFLVRCTFSEGIEHHIFYVVYNYEQQKFTEAKLIANAYGYESGWGETVGWITDFNKDGKKDILVQTSEEYYNPVGGGNLEDPTPILKQTYTTIIWLWKDSQLQEVKVTDTLLQQNLRRDFPFYSKHYSSYATEQKLQKLLINNHHKKSKDEKWVIILGSDKTFESAKAEKKRFEQLFGYNYKYEISTAYVETVEKNERFYTVFINSYITKNDTEIILRELKEKFNKTAYLVDFKSWCPNHKYTIPYCRKCPK